MFFKLIKVSFMQRRKTLLNALTNSGLITNKEKLKQVLEKMNLDLNIRGEKLTLEQYAKLANLINQGI